MSVSWRNCSFILSYPDSYPEDGVIVPSTPASFVAAAEACSVLIPGCELVLQYECSKFSTSGACGDRPRIGGGRRTFDHCPGNLPRLLSAWARPGLTDVPNVFPEQQGNGVQDVQTSLDEWPLASEPVGDDYTPARPDDVWFEDGSVLFIFNALVIFLSSAWRVDALEHARWREQMQAF